MRDRPASKRPSARSQGGRNRASPLRARAITRAFYLTTPGMPCPAYPTAGPGSRRGAALRLDCVRSVLRATRACVLVLLPRLRRLLSLRSTVPDRMVEGDTGQARGRHKVRVVRMCHRPSVAGLIPFSLSTLVVSYSCDRRASEDGAKALAEDSTVSDAKQARGSDI